MKRILISAGLILGAVSIYTPIAHAVAPTYTIDCSADTDPTVDNSDTDWVVYTSPVEVLTTNCAYSCAAGGTDQNTSCGSAWPDSYSDRTFSVTGTGWVDAYDPGFYGKTIYFGIDAAQINFSATPGVNSITFNWDSIENVDIYAIEANDVVEPDGIASSTLHRTGECTANAPTHTCTIQNLVPGVSHRYTITVHYDWNGWQEDVAAESVAALAPTTTTTEAETLANTGLNSTDNLAIALAMLSLGLAASFVLRRRITN